MLTTMSYLICDGCGHMSETLDTGKEVRAWARRAGWTRVARKGLRPADLCRKCTLGLRALSEETPTPYSGDGSDLYIPEART